MPMHIKASSSFEEHPSKLPEIFTTSTPSFKLKLSKYGILTKRNHGGQNENRYTPTKVGSTEAISSSG